MKTKLFFAGLVIIAFTSSVTAQTTATDQKTQNNSPRGVAWVDANSNGVCDNFENGTSNIQTGKRNFNNRGQGQRAGNGGGCGQGRHTKAGMRIGLAQGQGRGSAGMRQGRGAGKSFVDADKDGVCDNIEAPTKE
jgi:hypothetical protein